jgi:predicted PurR-regulated permease PerM
MNPVVVFIAIAFGAFIWSAVGMVVAVPVLVVVSVVADHVPAWDRLANFLAGDMAAPIDVTTDQDKATEDVTT